MAVKSVDMVRKIRDKHFEETKGLSVKERIRFIKDKSKDLQRRLKKSRGSAADNTAQAVCVNEQAHDTLYEEP